MRAASTGRGRSIPIRASLPGHGSGARLSSAAAGQDDAFQGAQHAPRVAQVDAGRGCRVQLGEPLSQGRQADLLHLGGQLAAQLGEVAGQQAVAVDQGADVQAGPADHDRQAAARPDLGHQLPRLVDPVGHRERGVGIDQVQQVVWHRRARGGIGLGGADVHAAVHLA